MTNERVPSVMTYFRPKRLNDNINLYLKIVKIKIYILFKNFTSIEIVNFKLYSFKNEIFNFLRY